MSLIFCLRILCDMSYYFCYAAFIAGGAGLSGPPVESLLIMTACCLPAFWLRKSLWRLAPLALMGFCAFFVHGTADAVVLVPPAIFVTLTVAKGLFFEDVYAFRGRFKLCAQILPALLLMGLILSHKTLEALSLPFWPMFLFSGVFLLRLLRQSEEILRQAKFKAINAATLLATAAMGLALGSQAVLSAIKSVLGAVYHFIFAPILLGVSYVFIGIIWLLEPLVKSLERAAEEEFQFPTAPGEASEEIFPEMVASEGSDIVARILLAIGLIILIVIIVLVFRKMLGKKALASGPSGVEEERGSAEDSKRAGRDLPLFGGTPRQRVRAIYRKFLQTCHRCGIENKPDDTSRKIAWQANTSGLSPGDEGDRLRDIYVSARYSEAEITNSDVKHMREKYNNIKAHINRKI